MAGVAGNQNEFVGQGDGGHFEIGKGERGSRLFQLGADSAADKNSGC